MPTIIVLTTITTRLVMRKIMEKQLKLRWENTNKKLKKMSKNNSNLKATKYTEKTSSKAKKLHHNYK